MTSAIATSAVDASVGGGPVVPGPTGRQSLSQGDLDVLVRGWETATRQVLPARSFVAIRVDGRSFGSYTRGLDRPFDAGFQADMDAAALALAQDVSGTAVVYVQSDEISVICSDLAGEATQHWMGGVVAKVVSLSAARASVAFSMARAARGARPAVFDGRAFALPGRTQVGLYLLRRQIDARRNALAMLCDSVLGKKATVGKGTGWRLAALEAAGAPFEQVAAGTRQGRIVTADTSVGDVEFVDRRTGTVQVARDVLRRTWTTGDAPDFADPAVLGPDGWLTGLLPADPPVLAV